MDANITPELRNLPLWVQYYGQSKRRARKVQKKCEHNRRRRRATISGKAYSYSKMILSRKTHLMLSCWCLGMMIITPSSLFMISAASSSSTDYSSIQTTTSSNNIILKDNSIVYDNDDDDLEEILLSDYDHSLDLLSDLEDEDEREQSVDDDFVATNKKLKIQSSSHGTKDKSQFHNRHSKSSTSRNDEEKDSVIILSAVDGTLAGISRTSGQMLWKQSRRGDDKVAEEKKEKTDQDDDKILPVLPPEWNKFLSPLVSSSMTKSPSSTEKHNSYYQWHAVPSVDGTVYLTGGDGTTSDTSTSHELSVSTHIRDLVDRAPFVDAQQRFFVGSRRAMVAAVDERTGEILRVIPKFNTNNDGNENEEEEVNDDEQLPPTLEGRDVVWIGRLEHSVTVHDLHKGTVDIEFSVAEILSVDEMIHGDSMSSSRQSTPSSVVFRDEDGDDDNEDITATQMEQEMERLFTDYITEALRHPNFGDRILRLPAPDESAGEDTEDIYADARAGGPSMSQGSAFLVSTPSGNVAFRDDSDSSTVGWVSFALLDSPVIYAIEASSGRKIRVNMLDDSSVSSATAGSTKEDNSLPQLLEQQIASLERSSSSSSLPGGSIVDEACLDGKSGECRAVGFSRQSVVGALQNGQIYALPLGERFSRPQLPLGLPQPHSSAASDMSNAQRGYQQSKLNTQHASIGFHEHRYDPSDDVDSGDKQQIHLDANTKQSCTPASPLYPGCLIGASLMMGNLLDVNGNVDMASLSDYIDLLEGNNRKKSSYFQHFIKIMSSWIAPTVALIFVLSFEMGRRERLKAEASKYNSDAISGDGISTDKSAKDQNNSTNNQGGVIQLSEEILGYGGHGTIVYKGVLDKRQVAVKRMLAMYHASADREISLLIESDGHPNVVRYFLKEMRGDFVYLALELCNMSLNDLILSLSKLRNNMRKGFQLSGGPDNDFEAATKSLLFQIASGVRHIHSLRIVHRDLKPQNILLALRNTPKSVVKPDENGPSDDSESEIEDTTHTTCSDTNTILEFFKNQEYIPKISDMGLGKQLAGQSSFGLSTLGTGSIGGGTADAGAGAGSVGWQAPEVMAQRWSPETSSNNKEESESLLEASPLEAGVNRTSRSVDIFSLGCIFYCTILPGSHPFGEWYEREANIMRNTPNREDLDFVSPDASDLILSMINRDAKARPTADEVCEHPFFWSLSKRLKFLCDLSDRIELCDTSTSQVNADNNLPTLSIYAIEKGAADIFGTSWEVKLDPELMEASLSRRTYDPSSVRDCLRMIRNKHHHYDELSTKLKNRIGSASEGLSSYISRTFPRLLIHCYHFCVSNLDPDDSLASDYNLPISREPSLSASKTDKMSIITDLSVLDDSKNCPPSLETILDDYVELEPEEKGRGGVELDDYVSAVTPESKEELGISPTVELQSPEIKHEESATPLASITVVGENTLQTNSEDLSGIVVWSGSNTAKELKCRGWYRSEDDWTQRLDSKLRKRDSNLVKCAEDPKFRTRLCNHWDVSKGTYCPMRKKNKCIFAHGPIELRVKEGKRHRWGTLVNKQGLCANAKASGGEDTYGAARNIENTRKEQGQWTTTDSKHKKQGKGKQSQIQKQGLRKKKEQVSCST